MKRLPLETQTLFAELTEQLVAYEAQRAIGHLPGGFVTKRLKGAEYYYYQYLEPGGVKRQVYVGRRTDALDAVVERYEAGRDAVAEEVASLERLAAQLRIGGASLSDAPTTRVVAALGNTGVFRAGGVLVGTHAFGVIGNLLGVRWTGEGLRTQDIDIAASRQLEVVVPPLDQTVPDVLQSLEMGFLPVPALDANRPSTSFKVRGQSLRVDLLAPVARATAGPVSVPRFGASAQGLKYLDYLIETPVSAPLVGGTPVLVNVPQAARFALHKLLVAAERPAAWAAKRRKDLLQAGQVLEVLFDDRPGDVSLAWEELAKRGRGWVNRASGQIGALPPAVADALRHSM